MSRVSKAQEKVLEMFEDVSKPLTKKEYQSLLEELTTDLEVRLDAVNVELARETPDDTEDDLDDDEEDDEKEDA